MARKNRIEIIINAKDNASRTLRGVAGSLQSIGKVALKATVVGLAAATAAITAFAVAGTKAFIDFEKGMNEVFTLLPDISLPAMQELEDGIQRLSRVFGTLTEDAVPALYQAISAGVPQENVFKFLEVANKAAIAGVTSLETAVDGISSVVNAYGEEILNATQASDLMFTSVRLGKTTFEELSATLSMVTPTASALGLGFENLTAAIATMTAQGINTAISTTALNGMLLELANSGTEVSKVFKEAAGKSFRVFIEQGGNLSDALNILAEGADAAGVPIDELFGNIRAGRAAMALTGANAAAFAENLEAMGASAGATDAAFAIMANGIAFQIGRLKAGFQNFLIDVGRLLAPFFAPFAKGLADTINILSSFLDGISRTNDELNEMFTDSGTGIFFRNLIRFIAPVITAFARLAKDLDPDNPDGFFGALAAGMTPFQAFIALLGRIGLGSLRPFVVWVNIAVDAVRRFIAPIIQWIRENVILKDVLIAFGLVLASVILPGLAALVVAIAPVAAAFAALIGLIGFLRRENIDLLSIFNSAVVAAGQLPILLLALLDTAAQGAQDLINLIIVIFLDGLTRASKTAMMLVSIVQVFVTRIITSIKLALADFLQGVSDITQAMHDFITPHLEVIIAMAAIIGAILLVKAAVIGLTTVYTAAKLVVLGLASGTGIFTGALALLFSPVVLLTVAITALLFALNQLYPGGLVQLFTDASVSATMLAQIGLTTLSVAVENAISLFTQLVTIIGLVKEKIDDITPSLNIPLPGGLGRSVSPLDIATGIFNPVGFAANQLGEVLSVSNRHGGSISGPSIVGEGGRELFIPDSPGRIVNNRDTELALGGVTLNFNFSGAMTRDDARRSADMTVRELRARGVPV